MERLTLRDLGATLCMLAATVIYWAHEVSSSGTWDGSRFTAALLFVLALTASGVQGEVNRSTPYGRAVHVAGVVGFTLFVIVLITGSEVVLGLLFALLVLVWAVTTIRHAMGKHVPKPPIYATDG